jgi:hypothetical protein
VTGTSTAAQLKAEWTDKYVEAMITVPEYARFRGMTGRVVTVNENGKCLVDFGDGPWYDIPPNVLKIVPKPEKPLPKK